MSPVSVIDTIIMLEAVLVSPTDMHAEASSRLVRALESAAAIGDATENQMQLQQKSAAGIFSRVVRAIASEQLAVKHLVVPVEPPHSDAVDIAVVGFMPLSHASNPIELISALQPSVNRWHSCRG
jgi:hypothetical protein